MVNEIAYRNHEFIELIRSKVERLNHWATENCAQARKTIQMFEKRMMELREMFLYYPQNALNALLEEMIEEARRAQHNAAQAGESDNAPSPAVS